MDIIKIAEQIVKSKKEQNSTHRNIYINTLSDWLHLEDIQAIEIIMATAISIALPGDPVWLFVIAPAGSAKTEILRSFTGDNIFSISTLTPQTLISGLKGSTNVDLLPKLDGKLLIIKDFTSILSKKNEDQMAIFADLREAYDGYLEKSFGSGVGTKKYTSRFGLIAGVTEAIDRYRIVHSQLGERFLKCRLFNNSEAAIAKASALAGKEDEMREALSQATTDCLNYYTNSYNILGSQLLEVEYKTRRKIESLANITAKLRSEVDRDRHRKVVYQPRAEVGTRLSKQFIKLGQSLAVFYENSIVDEKEYDALKRIAYDSIPGQRIRLISSLLDTEPMTTKEAGDVAKIPTDTAKEILEDLWMLGLVERTGEKAFQWQLNERTNVLLTESDLGMQSTLSKHENKQ